jgi:hypothetical protein
VRLKERNLLFRANGKIYKKKITSPSKKKNKTYLGATNTSDLDSIAHKQKNWHRSKEWIGMVKYYCWQAIRSF